MKTRVIPRLVRESVIRMILIDILSKIIRNESAITMIGEKNADYHRAIDNAKNNSNFEVRDIEFRDDEEDYISVGTMYTEELTRNIMVITFTIVFSDGSTYYPTISMTTEDMANFMNEVIRASM